MPEYNDEKYNAAKEYWVTFLLGLKQRDESDEEDDAFINAIDCVFYS